ncbi:MAG: hypothetical protein ACR2P1_28815 [Pseudomonadales bacterium]
MVIDGFAELIPVLHMAHDYRVTGDRAQIAKIPENLPTFPLAGDTYPALGGHYHGLLRCSFIAFPLNP